MLFKNVIFPNEGTGQARLAMAPAADLAWRGGAKLVVVSNTKANDSYSKSAVKLQAMAKSESEVELWMDLEHPLAEAALVSASYREACVFCLATPRTRGGLSGRRRRKGGLGPILPELVARGTAPIVVIGPGVSTDHGLPMTSVVLVLDGTADTDALMDVAAAWASELGLGLVLTMVPAVGVSLSGAEIEDYLERRVALVAVKGGVEVDPVGDPGGLDGLLAVLSRHDQAAAMMSPGPVGSALEVLPASVISNGDRVVILVRRD